MSAMKTALYLLCLLTVAMQGKAQDSTVQYQSPRVILKLAPLSLLDPDATIQGGVEVRISRRNAIQAEVGFGRKGMQIVNDEKKNFSDWSIWRARSEWRHYTNHYRTNTRKNIRIRSPFPLGNYWAIEGFAKQINGTKAVVLYDPDPAFPNNQQQIDRLVLGSHVKWGRQIAIPGRSLTDLSRVLLDFYVGLGVRYGITNTSFSSQDCSCGPYNDRFQQGKGVQPSLAAGVKIGFGL